MYASEKVKRSQPTETSNPKSVKRAKIDPSTNQSVKSTYSCELCQNHFASAANLRQHMESFHMRTTMWECSECKKLFTSKSNLKVHLRVHTKIKPYHCRHCNYTCMHHSSIKEHLNRIHPGTVHSSATPGYVFNTVAVPDPIQFNSGNFDRAAFIEVAKESNIKLVEKISNQKQLSNSVNISPISSASSLSSSFQSKQGDGSFINEHSQSISSNDSLSEHDNLPRKANDPIVKPKYTSFSISSLLGEDALEKKVDPAPSYVSPGYTIDQWNYNNQLQIYFKYLCQMHMNKTC